MGHGIDGDELDRLFQRGRISRRQFVAALGALGATAAAIEAVVGSGPGPAGAQSDPPQYLVVIVLDAFRPEYMRLSPMPALQGLMKAGTYYDRAWVGQLESETPVGHATLSTGSLPRHDGIIGFEWRDPVTKKKALDGWPPGVLAGDMERDMLRTGANSISQAVKASDHTAKVVALSSEKVYAADAMGGHAADYILYHQRTGTGKRTLLPAAVPGHQPPASFFSSPHLHTQLPMKHFTDWDYLSAMLALAAFHEFRPKVLMVNLPGGDVYGHPSGGPADPAVMRAVTAGLDRNIARIVGAYKQAGIYAQTLFVVTADHGMVPNTHAVPGSVTKQVVKQNGGQYLFHTGGTAADIYLNNWWHARAVAGGMAKVPNVAAAYYQTHHKGQYEYVPAPGQTLPADLDAAYQYLLSTFAGPTAPDIVAPYRENTIGGAFNSAHGDHGGLNWGAQHIPLVFAGPGVRSGFRSQAPARLMDIAPTVLRLLGLPVGRMDGTVLADALQDAAANDVAAQTRTDSVLTPYQNALITQTTDDVAEDKQRRQAPPPPARLAP